MRERSRTEKPRPKQQERPSESACTGIARATSIDKTRERQEGLRHGVEEVEREVARGKSEWTPLLLFGGIATVVWSFAALLALLALAIWWWLT